MPTDPLHMQSPPGIMWTTVNTQEALPGVPTPLGWTFFDNSMERALRGGLFDLGVLTREEAKYQPTDQGATDPFHQRSGAVFFGRVAVNLTFLRAMADRLPGTSGDALELQLLGGISPGAVSAPTRRRYPAIALRAPLAGLLLPHRLRQFKVRNHSWWQSKVGKPQPGVAGLGARLAAATGQFEAALRLHCSSTRFLAQGAYEQLRLLAEEAGEPGLELTIASGYGTVEETQAAVALWDVSRNQMSLEAFLLEHGFHGPDEGEISSRVWREDPRPVRILAEKYASKANGSDPRRGLQERVAQRAAAESRVISRLSPIARKRARIVLPIARRYLPLVEVTKGALVRSIDVGRAAARAAGVELADCGLLKEPDDIFYLTVDELISGVPTDATDRIAFRSERRAEYQDLEVPERWIGQPEAGSRKPETGEPDRLTGIPASAGVVEGPARVVHDASAADTVLDGEIIVCEITDPSWVLAFTVAGGVVIDVGGVMSHGAIVAREMGLPCVINVRNGTSLIETGDVVRVDGTSGLVTILARQPA